MRTFLLACSFILLHIPLFAQLSAQVELKKCSTLSIFVETNMMDFSLVQRGDQLQKGPVSISANVEKNRISLDRNRLEIDVKGFKSENPIGLREFFKLLQVDRFPKMNVELLRYETNPDVKSTGSAVLNITITNVTRTYEFPVSVGKANGLMHIVGRKRISITDFGLSAPKTLLFGMAKVNEQIVIDLNLLCSLRMASEELAER